MAFRSSLADLCTQAVSIRAKSSLNNYGEAQYSGTATVFDAYVQRFNRVSSSPDRDQTIAEWVAYIPSSTLTVGPDDEVEYPTGIIRPIISIDYRFDEEGQQFVVLSIGKAQRQ